MRPRRRCRIQFCPPSSYFVPAGIAQRDLKVIELDAEEAEALRLRNIVGLDQTKAAGKMGVSQSTYQRILTAANRKVTEALMGGKAIKIKTKNI